MKNIIAVSVIRQFEDGLNTNIKKTKSHIQPSLSVVSRFLMENIKVKDNDQILQNHVIECNKKSPTFICYCEIKNECFSGEMMLGWLSNPDVYLAGKLQSRYICDRNELVNMKKVFITNLENQSYKQYL